MYIQKCYMVIISGEKYSRIDAVDRDCREEGKIETSNKIAKIGFTKMS